MTLNAARLLPELAGDLDWIDPSCFPLGLLVAGTMNLAVVDPAERYGEFVADLAGERPRLGEPQVVRIRGLAAADQARLLGNEAQVLAVAIAPRRRHGKDALVGSGEATRDQ
jgi:hypothetical protein